MTRPIYGDGRSDGDRSVGSSAGRAGREGKLSRHGGVCTTWFACLSLHGQTNHSFYIVTIIIIITSSQWSCSRPHPSYWWYNRSKASLLLLGMALLRYSRGGHKEQRDLEQILVHSDVIITLSKPLYMVFISSMRWRNNYLPYPYDHWNYYQLDLVFYLL